MRIGIDFDNTIAGYDHAFADVGVREGLLADGFAGTKKEAREVIRVRPDGERQWMRLQGRVYGAHMAEAVLMDGVADFLGRCREAGVAVCIVSHKTEYGHFDADRVSLRDASRSWMEAKGLFDADRSGLTHDDVHFESTRAEKIARIAALACSHFIDDLEEVLREPGFPDAVERYLYAAGGGPLPEGPFKAFHHWRDISDDILGDHR